MESYILSFCKICEKEYLYSILCALLTAFSVQMHFESFFAYFKKSERKAFGLYENAFVLLLCEISEFEFGNKVRYATEIMNCLGYEYSMNRFEFHGYYLKQQLSRKADNLDKIYSVLLDMFQYIDCHLESREEFHNFIHYPPLQSSTLISIANSNTYYNKESISG